MLENVFKIELVYTQPQASLLVEKFKAVTSQVKGTLNMVMNSGNKWKHSNNKRTLLIANEKHCIIHRQVFW